jgi:hypothetical protein|tara:strand:+ start:335 stop:589 length:255 start_codon:yes stop_codon:yes gene_type:complete
MSDEKLADLFSRFSGDGTPLPSTIGSKLEWGVTILTAGMLSNENLAAQMTAEEMVDAAINYYNVIQERLGYYTEHQAHSLEKLI